MPKMAPNEATKPEFRWLDYRRLAGAGILILPGEELYRRESASQVERRDARQPRHKNGMNSVLRRAATAAF